MLVRPLPDGNVLTHLNFRLTWPYPAPLSCVAGGGGSDCAHFNIFPKVVHEMVARYGVGEFHLSFAQGLWLNDRWGHAPVPAPHGAQLHAWFAPEEALAGAPGPPGAPVGLGARWRGLTNALAGLFGASINVLEADTRHAHPRRALRPASSWLRAAWGSDAGGDAPASHLFVGSLPRETACTENFTPWAKLLPCRARAGLAALMRPARLCGGLYTAYTAHASVECAGAGAGAGCGGGARVLVLALTLSSVSNANLRERSPSNSLRTAVRAAPPTFAAAFALTDLSGALGARGCSLADASRVHLHVIPALSRAPHLVWNASWGGRGGAGGVERELGEGEGRVATFDVTYRPTAAEVQLKAAGGGLGLAVRWALLSPRALACDAAERGGGGAGACAGTALGVRRFLAGLQSDRGELVLELENRHASAAARVHVLETLPWFLRAHLHTLRVAVAGAELPAREALREGHVSPAGLRAGMTVVEYAVVVPPGARAEVRLTFDKSFLTLDEFPPDANRGFDLPPARVAYAPPAPPPLAVPPQGAAAPEACSALGAGGAALGAGGAPEACAHEGLLHTCRDFDQVAPSPRAPAGRRAAERRGGRGRSSGGWRSARPRSAR